MRTSSRSCGVSAPTRAVSTGIAAISPKRCFQKSISSCSLLPTSAASPASTGLSSFLAIVIPLFLCDSAALSRHRFAHIVGDLLQRRTRRKDFLDAHRAERRPVGLGDDAPAEQE